PSIPATRATSSAPAWYGTETKSNTRSLPRTPPLTVAGPGTATRAAVQFPGLPTVPPVGLPRYDERCRGDRAAADRRRGGQVPACRPTAERRVRPDRR